MAINLRHHHFEGSCFMKDSDSFTNIDHNEHKIHLWNTFVDSNLIGLTEEDCGIFPRVLPLSYLSEIKKAAHKICLFTMKLLELPASEVKAILPAGPIRDFLIEELEVLKHRPDRLVGSFRYDMAIVGDPAKGNPPKLLEINDIGFGGISRSTYLQNTLFQLQPSLKKRYLTLDATKAEANNYLALGPSYARLQYDAYDWEEQVLLKEAQKHGVSIRLISPKQLKFKWNSSHYPLMSQSPIHLKNNKIMIGSSLKSQWAPQALQMGYSFELQDFLRSPEMYRQIIKSDTPQYSPFVTGLVASKAILVLLADKQLQRKFLGSSQTMNHAILPAHLLHDKKEIAQKNYKNFVLKHVDGLGGEKVFFDQQLAQQLKKIPKTKESEWVLQDRIKLNTIELEGTLSRKRKLIADLGVFVQYQWSKGKFQHFEVGGFITRATNKSYKVNVSGGGIQVPVFFDRAA